MTKTALIALCTAMACAGCTGRKDPPLIFGAGHTFGVSIGAATTDSGADFVVGYKGSNLALIPVSAIQSGGGEELIGTVAPSGHKDTYSVFGQFEGNAARTQGGAESGLGKFFATGTAAQTVARGYAYKMGLGRGCNLTQPAAADAATALAAKLDEMAKAINSQAATQRRIEQRLAQSGSIVAAKQAGAAQAGGPTNGGMLVFAQYDYLAVAVDGSAADQSFKFTLGFKDRNLAIVPVVGRDAEGRITRLGTANPDSGDDAFSVLGQFASKNTVDGSQSASALNSFFSTGFASEILAAGFKVKLCDEYQAPGAAPAPAKADTTKTATTTTAVR